MIGMRNRATMAMMMCMHVCGQWKTKSKGSDDHKEEIGDSQETVLER